MRAEVWNMRGDGFTVEFGELDTGLSKKELRGVLLEFGMGVLGFDSEDFLNIHIEGHPADEYEKRKIEGIKIHEPEKE